MPAITLSDAISRYGHDAFLLTIGKDGPHTSHVSVDLRGSVIGCSLGTSAAKNISRDPNVSLFWPPGEPVGYAMIFNGVATGMPQPNGVVRAEISVTKSVLHRKGPNPANSDGQCESDCRRVVV